MPQTLTYDLDLTSRTIQIELPGDIKLGKCHVVLTINEQADTPDNFQKLLDATKGIWKQGDGLNYQETIRGEW